MLPVLGKKAVLEWCMEGLIGSSYVCPKCGKSMGKKEWYYYLTKGKSQGRSYRRSAVSMIRGSPSDGGPNMCNCNPTNLVLIYKKDPRMNFDIGPPQEIATPMARVITSQSLKILIMRGYSLEELSTLVIHPTTYNISWEFHFRGNQKTLVGPKFFGKKRVQTKKERNRKLLLLCTKTEKRGRSRWGMCDGDPNFR
ncbi:hypothetical protein TNCV_1974001 [Trichonephila clavipes]|nr:hypothetical protein TNCV_1974001 [Trichonephila clavipes]